MEENLIINPVSKQIYLFDIKELEYGSEIKPTLFSNYFIINGELYFHLPPNNFYLFNKSMKIE